MRRLILFLAVFVLLFGGLSYATKFIRDDATGGDCISIGTWDSATKTCTLTTDVFETIQIDNDFITLDSNGRALTGNGSGFGINISGLNNVTAKNANVKNFSNGIMISASNSINLENSSITENKDDGIEVSSSNEILIQDSSIISNANNGIFATGSNFIKIINSNINFNKDDGVDIRSGNNNNLTNNTILSNSNDGIHAEGLSNTRIEGNEVHFNKNDGVHVTGSNNMEIINNSAFNNSNNGFYLSGSNSNRIEMNMAEFNKNDGLHIVIDNSIIVENSIRANLNNAIFLDGNTNMLVDNNINGTMFITSSTANSIYNNNFLNDSDVFVTSSGENYFDNGLVIGGNYWTKFDTPEEGCNNLNNDTFCDSPYLFSGEQDDFPWVLQNGWSGLLNRGPGIFFMFQLSSDATIEIPEGGTLLNNSIMFSVSLRSPLNRDVKLQVEFRKISEPFTGIFDGGIIESGFESSGSTVDIVKNDLEPGEYHWRARGVNSADNISEWIEFGSPDNVDFVVPGLVPSLGNLTVTVQVFDSRNSAELKAPTIRKLKNATVELLKDSVIIDKQSTDSNGQVIFKGKEPGIYSVRVVLNNTDFAIYYIDTLVIAVKNFVEITNDPQQNLVIDLSCSELQPCDPDLISTVIPNDRIDDLAIIYYHMQQVMDFERERLGFDRRAVAEKIFISDKILLSVFAYSTGTFYRFDPNSTGTVHEMHISEEQSKITFSGKPMNVEWHEASHELMDLVDNNWQWETFPENYSTHAGYFENPTTAGSWIEGWATFFPLAIWDYYREKGEFQGPADWYRMGGKPVNMEVNRKAWDNEWIIIPTTPPQLPVQKAQREDFAVASLLWDLYDPEDIRDFECGNFDVICLQIISDQINLGNNEEERIRRLWKVFSNSSYSIANVRNLWDVLKTEGIGAGDPDGNALDFLDEVYILHGFFRDTTPTDKEYNLGEVVAYTCNVLGCTRPSTPYIFGANIQVNLTDQQGNPITNGTVIVEVSYQSPLDFMNYTSQFNIEDLLNGTIYIEPQPEDVNPTFSVYVVTPDDQKSNTLSFSNDVYIQQVEQAQEINSSVAIQHNFTSGEENTTTVLPLEVQIDIVPRSTANIINLTKKIVQVAILNTTEFNVLDVNISTVRFGPKNATAKRSFLRDIDRDRDLDLIFAFLTKDTGIKLGDTAACLVGRTFEGQLFQGCDTITVVT